MCCKTQDLCITLWLNHWVFENWNILDQIGTVRWVGWSKKSHEKTFLLFSVSICLLQRFSCVSTSIKSKLHQTEQIYWCFNYHLHSSHTFCRKNLYLKRINSWDLPLTLHTYGFTYHQLRILCLTIISR